MIDLLPPQTWTLFVHSAMSSILFLIQQCESQINVAIITKCYDLTMAVLLTI